VGSGKPLAWALKVTLAPAGACWLIGCWVNTGASWTASVAGALVTWPSGLLHHHRVIACRRGLHVSERQQVVGGAGMGMPFQRHWYVGSGRPTALTVKKQLHRPGWLAGGLLGDGWNGHLLVLHHDPRRFGATQGGDLGSAHGAGR